MPTARRFACSRQRALAAGPERMSWCKNRRKVWMQKVASLLELRLCRGALLHWNEAAQIVKDWQHPAAQRLR